MNQIFNSIVFVTGGSIWITQDEATSMSQDLMNGKPFISLPRLGKTFNSQTIASVGPNSIFSDPLVNQDGAQFAFTYYTVMAKVGDNEYMWNKGWKNRRGSFSGGMTFDDFIATQHT